MSWARDAVAVIRKIVLIEERMEALTAQVNISQMATRTSTAGWCGWRLSSI